MNLIHFESGRTVVVTLGRTVTFDRILGEGDGEAVHGGLGRRRFALDSQQYKHNYTHANLEQTHKVTRSTNERSLLTRSVPADEPHRMVVRPSI
jgi:hypothetical protein